MNEPETLIPPPSVVQERLAKNIKEQRLLRSLLGIAIRATKEARDLVRTSPSSEADEGVAQ